MFRFFFARNNFGFYSKTTSKKRLRPLGNERGKKYLRNLRGQGMSLHVPYEKWNLLAVDRPRSLIRRRCPRPRSFAKCLESSRKGRESHDEESFLWIVDGQDKRKTTLSSHGVSFFETQFRNAYYSPIRIHQSVIYLISKQVYALGTANFRLERLVVEWE